MRSTRAFAALAFVACASFASACSRSAAPPAQTAAPTPSGSGSAIGSASQGAPAPSAGEGAANAPAPSPMVAPPTSATTRGPMPPGSAGRGGPGGSGGGGGGVDGTQPMPASGTANPFDEHGRVAENNANGVECQSDHDCACGVDRADGRCAFGPVARIDATRQCPDFCGGISGAMRVACDRGRCVQR